MMIYLTLPYFWVKCWWSKRVLVTVNNHQVGDGDLEPDRKADMFDNEEEHVGIDDENMYINSSAT